MSNAGRMCGAVEFEAGSEGFHIHDVSRDGSVQLMASRI